MTETELKHSKTVLPMKEYKEKFFTYLRELNEEQWKEFLEPLITKYSTKNELYEYLRAKAYDIDLGWSREKINSYSSTLHSITVRKDTYTKLFSLLGRTIDKEFENHIMSIPDPINHLHIDKAILAFDEEQKRLLLKYFVGRTNKSDIKAMLFPSNKSADKEDCRGSRIENKRSNSFRSKFFNDFRFYLYFSAAEAREELPNLSSIDNLLRQRGSYSRVEHCAREHLGATMKDIDIERIDDGVKSLSSAPEKTADNKTYADCSEEEINLSDEELARLICEDIDDSLESKKRKAYPVSDKHGKWSSDISELVEEHKINMAKSDEVLAKLDRIEKLIEEKWQEKVLNDSKKRKVDRII